MELKNIFPGTSRVFQNQVGQKILIGKYTVSLNATYGDEGRLLTSAVTLWVFPWRVATAGLLALIIIILVIVFISKRTHNKEEKLVEVIAEEKSEIEALKEKLKDQMPTSVGTEENKPEIPSNPESPEPKDNTTV